MWEMITWKPNKQKIHQGIEFFVKLASYIFTKFDIKLVWIRKAFAKWIELKAKTSLSWLKVFIR